MATYTLGTALGSRSSSHAADEAATRSRLDPRRPLVAFAVTVVICAGLVLVPADAAADEVMSGGWVLTAHENGPLGQVASILGPGDTIPTCHATGSADNPYAYQEPSATSGGPAGHGGHGGDIFAPFLFQQNVNSPVVSVPGQNTHLTAYLDNDCTAPASNPGDDDDDVAGDDDDDVVGDDDDDIAGDDDDDIVGDDDDDVVGDDDDDAPSSDGPTPLSDDPSTPQAPEVFGIVEEDEPADGSETEVLGETEELGAAPEELAFTGPAGAVPLALGGSSFMAAGAAMVLAGRRRRPTEQRQAWWERVTS